MTEQSAIWMVKGSGNTRRCLKHGIVVSGCAYHLDCKDCEYAQKEVKDAPNEPQKTPHTDSVAAKKGVRKRRNEGSCGPNNTGKTIKVPEVGDNSKIRRRPRAPNKKRVNK